VVGVLAHEPRQALHMLQVCRIRYRGAAAANFAPSWP
jgi:hypothetical protein